MNLIKRTAISWSNLCDRLFYNRKARRIWNHYICPAIEVIGYGLAAMLLALTIYIITVSIVLLA